MKHAVGHCEAGSALAQPGFVATLMESGVEFVATDLPFANSLFLAASRQGGWTRPGTPDPAGAVSAY